MNYLQLVQRLRKECGVSGTGPTSVVGQTGTSELLVGWINSAWIEIQGLHDNWDFMRSPFSFQAYANVGDYTTSGGAGVGAGLSDLRYWHADTFRAQKTADGVSDQQWLVQWEYQVFRDTYRFGLQTPGRPVVFAINPMGKALMLGSIPDAQYTITGEYQKQPYDLVANEDVPNIPDHLHMVIVYKAMQSYGMYEAAPEVVSRGETQYTRMLNQLEREELPQVYLGDPLA